MKRHVSVILLVLCVSGLLAPIADSACPVNLYREYNPTHPPQILTSPPVREIASPYQDPNAPPPGTQLTFYRVHQTTDPDTIVPVIFLTKTGNTVRIEWQGGPDPAACCLPAGCSMLCRTECETAGGDYVGDGTACSDIPPPCLATTCHPSNPLYGFRMESKGGTTFTNLGIPSTAPVEFLSVNTSTGAITASGLILTDESERVWNFTGTADPEGRKYYYAGGRYGNAVIKPTVVAMDTAATSVSSNQVLTPEKDIVHLALNHYTGVLYGLALNSSGGLSFGGGHLYFTQTLILVTVDPTTGAVTEIGSDLPAGLDHYAAALDGEGGRYFYHAYTGSLGRLVVVSLSTGSFTIVSVQDTIADLQFDDAAKKLYGLRLVGSGTISGSAAEGWRTTGSVDLVEINPATGNVTTIKTGLPSGTTNWVSGFDCDLGHYIYASGTGEIHVLDAATGNLLTTSPPPSDGRVCSLD